MVSPDAASEVIIRFDEAELGIGVSGEDMGHHRAAARVAEIKTRGKRRASIDSPR